MSLIQYIFASFTLIAFGCTTVQEIKRPNGKSEYLIACGAATGWNICFEKANDVCPAGYKTILKDGGFNRKELTISCSE